ncbi:MAG: PD-(D/E)XK nuclease family protein, partial [Planctomycetes bacterium]|nr:PD-(D/E)XK nuclease family protein [Planctomycetota bacterium]
TWASSLRRHAEELGVPISGGELPTGYTAASRRTASILELIRRGPQAMASEFIESMGPSVDTELCRRWDLAARALGRSRVADLAGLEVLSTLGEDAIFKLPSRPGSGMMISASGELTERRHAARRVTRDELHQLETRASRWLEFLSAASTPAPAAQQARQLVQAIEAGLGWPSLGDQETPDWLSEIPRLAHELGTCLLVDRDEFVTLLAARWRALGKEGLGGLGGGVQILELAQARGLACEELFVLGMERGVLPATGREDPWLPDAVRRRLRERLPQLGLAAERRDEEAHLFASLLAAAPHVTLIRQRCDEDGKELAASPYLAPAMQDADDPSEPIPRPLPALFERSRSRRRPLPAREAALAFGLAGDELNWADRLDHSHTEARQRFGVPPRRTSDTLGSRGEAHRLRLAFDRPIAMLSPWMGRVGLPSAGDPRGDAPWVTTLERVHRCPWQAFLMGVLQLRPTPEWHDKLPGIDRLLIGNAVHRAMEIHAEGRGTDDQPDLDATSLHALLARAAREEAGRLGISLAGFQRALIAVIRPYVELALHELRGQALVASEREGRLEVKDLRRDGTFHLQFRVDQVRTENGRPVLVDYKTGRTPPSEAVKPETRRKYLVRGLREGSLLQGMAYALSSGGEGRYVYLHPDIREDCRTWPVSADDKELVDHFLVAANLAHSALARGVLPARMDMSDGKANEACGNCEFKPACHLDDSGARMRLREFSQQLKSRAGARTPTDTDDGIHCDLWHHGRETSA